MTKSGGCLSAPAHEVEQYTSTGCIASSHASIFIGRYLTLSIDGATVHSMYLPVAHSSSKALALVRQNIIRPNLFAKSTVIAIINCVICVQARGLGRHVPSLDEGSAHQLLPVQRHDWHTERSVQQSPVHATAHHHRRPQPAWHLVLLAGAGPLPLLCILLGYKPQQGWSQHGSTHCYAHHVLLPLL